MGFPEAEARLFDGVWICMSCNAKQRMPEGRIPKTCRKCGKSGQFRKKHKKKK